MLLCGFRVLLLTILGQCFDSLGERAHDIVLTQDLKWKTFVFPTQCLVFLYVHSIHHPER